VRRPRSNLGARIRPGLPAGALRGGSIGLGVTFRRLTFLPMPRANWKTKRAALFRRLGGKCAVCGSTEELQIDHKRPRNWTPHDMSNEARVRAYAKAIRDGNAQLLCPSHHSEKTNEEQKSGGLLELIVAVLEPF
jgi:5-methylcytosine-specific restriction endonuclease McrA